MNPDKPISRQAAHQKARRLAAALAAGREPGHRGRPAAPCPVCGTINRGGGGRRCLTCEPLRPRGRKITRR